MSNIETTVQQESEVTLLKKIYNFGGKFIDYKMGLLGAGIMSSVVFGINYHETHELFGASTAALKQGSYTLVFGGVVMRGCEYLATKIKKKALALTASIIIPTATSVCLTYGVHKTRGTPKPFESTIPTATLLIPATAFWGNRKRRQYQVQK